MSSHKLGLAGQEARLQARRLILQKVNQHLIAQAKRFTEAQPKWNFRATLLSHRHLNRAVRIMRGIGLSESDRGLLMAAGFNPDR